jgi:nitrite reductase/ring-hydroxylating ferredoxin subunit
MAPLVERPSLSFQFWARGIALADFPQQSYSSHSDSRLNCIKSSRRSAIPMPECFVAKAADLKDGDRRIVVSGQHEVGVFFKDGAYYAYSNYCVHSGGPACEGILVNKVVDVLNADRTYERQDFADEVHFVCPWHGYEYDLKTGECIGDRRLRLRKYNVVKRGDDVFVVI